MEAFADLLSLPLDMRGEVVAELRAMAGRGGDSAVVADYACVRSIWLAMMASSSEVLLSSRRWTGSRLAPMLPRDAGGRSTGSVRLSRRRYRSLTS